MNLRKTFCLCVVMLSLAVRLSTIAYADEAAGERIEILKAKIVRQTSEEGFVTNTVTVTGASGLKVKKIVVLPGEKQDDYRVLVTTDNFDPKLWDKMVVRVDARVLVPFSAGGDKDFYYSFELRDIDKATMEALNGGPLSEPPKSDIVIEYTPIQVKLGHPLQVLIDIRSVCQRPLKIYWGTHGGSNYRCRDTQISFQATLDGNAVARNPKPLPDGFISSPFILKPNSRLRRTEELDEWLQIDKPGKYRVTANYIIQIENPDDDGNPHSWKVGYTNEFLMEVTN